MPTSPIEPPSSNWQFPATADLNHDLVGVGADLDPATLLEAYRTGIFPMPFEAAGDAGSMPAGQPAAAADTNIATARANQPGNWLLGWWSPRQRGVLIPQDMRQTRSLRRSRKRYRITVDLEFAAVVEGCALAHTEGVWLTTEMQQAYLALHKLGWAHSVEAWTPDGQLAGGLYGIAIGQLFIGESMFAAATDASKVALAALAEGLAKEPDSLIDTQWLTDHLESLGATSMPRAAYEARIAQLVSQPPLKFFVPPA